ncbi:MAG TPA: type 4a pilus biogenesis protein PilO [Solirubrobacterales bacterium]|nr:type 4a pilus biogenesis protein PilO [Solirubrobacterales bacterium]
MKALKTDSGKVALAAMVVVALAIAFWLLLLAPKREKADELAVQAEQLSTEVLTEQQRAATAAEAKENFSANYQQLVELGKAVPAEAATPSLLVQLDEVSSRSKTEFVSISLGGEAGEGETAEATEGSAAQLPLGASVGPAGLPAMPYTLEFDGGFFAIADFIEGLDALVETKHGGVDAKGRLITIDGFNLAPRGENPAESASGELHADFSVTTYVTPPEEGLTAGATSAGPETETTSTLP